MLNTDVQTQATTTGPIEITSSTSVTLAPIQNSSDITTQETSQLSTTPGKKIYCLTYSLYQGCIVQNNSRILTLFPFTVTKTEQCCIDFNVAYECLGLCYGLDTSDDENNENSYGIGDCETYVEEIEFCQNQ